MGSASVPVCAITGKLHVSHSEPAAIVFCEARPVVQQILRSPPTQPRAIRAAEQPVSQSAFSGIHLRAPGGRFPRRVAALDVFDIEARFAQRHCRIATDVKGRKRKTVTTGSDSRKLTGPLFHAFRIRQKAPSIDVLST